MTTYRTTGALRVGLLLATSIVVTACAALGAKPPVVSDRPDFTESTPTIDPGHVQVEAGTTYSEEGPVSSTSVGELFTRIGLTGRSELRLVGNSEVYSRLQGATGSWEREDATLGFKFRLLGAADAPPWKPTLSLIAGTTLPTGSAGLRAPHLQPEAKLLASWTLTERLTFSSNANYARVESAEPGYDEYSGSVSFGFTLTQRVGAYAEAFAFFPQGAGGETRKFVNVGTTLLLNPDLQLDARVGAGPSTKTGDFFVGIGVVRRW